jgi:hypothetical protein
MEEAGQPKSDGGDGTRERRTGVIQKLTALRKANGVDEDLQNALFISRHPGFLPEHFGYPPGDFILIDLIRLIDHYEAAAQNA